MNYTRFLNSTVFFWGCWCASCCLILVYVVVLAGHSVWVWASVLIFLPLQWPSSDSATILLVKLRFRHDNGRNIHRWDWLWVLLSQCTRSVVFHGALFCAGFLRSGVRGFQLQGDGARERTSLIQGGLLDSLALVRSSGRWLFSRHSRDKWLTLLIVLSGELFVRAAACTVLFQCSVQCIFSISGNLCRQIILVGSQRF